MDPNGIPPMLAPPQQPEAPAPGQGQAPGQGVDIQALLAQLSPEELEQWLATSTAGAQTGLLERQRSQANGLHSQNHDPRGWFQGLAGGLQNGLADYQAQKALKGEQALVSQQGAAHQMMGSKVAAMLAALRNRGAPAATASPGGYDPLAALQAPLLGGGE